ncbi:transporter, betaine/carnitine/choline family [Oribacterium sp. oral taxon 078 str. F0262]|nr:transporter, betaine/carnitine/choline family [Oribacterium sp. oral taxon 078 str. F0262]
MIHSLKIEVNEEWNFLTGLIPRAILFKIKKGGKKMNKRIAEKGKDIRKIDWGITLIPVFSLLVLSALFFLLPEDSNRVLSQIRAFIGEEFGVLYLALGLGIFLFSLWLAFSDIGKLVLGEVGEKPKYSFFAWGSMMFTAGLAADILFYSLCEWILYAKDPHIAELGTAQDWASTFTLFHWGLTPWAFYLVLAAAFGFMLHVRRRERQRYSEACRPLLGKHTDGMAGRLIDLLAVFALLAGTATTFSVATPLMSEAVRSLTGTALPQREITILILILTCIVYTYSVMRGMQGISFLAKTCTFLFYGILLYVLLFGGECRYILETGFSAIGRLLQNFLVLSTDSDPTRRTGFPQNWTIFYWAYWMVWCVAAPFFIGSISRGRTIRQTILGGYLFGVGSTWISFIILGNYSLGLQELGKQNLLSFYETSASLYETIIVALRNLPFAPLLLVILILTMIAFYATSFDSIALVASQYSYRRLPDGEEPANSVKGLWAFLLILLPLALVFSESSMANLQSVSIIAAFPIGFVILLISLSFWKDVKCYQAELSASRNGGEDGIGKEKSRILEEIEKSGRMEDSPSEKEIEELIVNWERAYGEA